MIVLKSLYTLVMTLLVYLMIFTSNSYALDVVAKYGADLDHNMYFAYGELYVISSYEYVDATTIRIRSSNHGLSNGDYVTIMDSEYYLGSYAVSGVTNHTFNITDTFINNELGTYWMHTYDLTSYTASAKVYTDSTGSTELEDLNATVISDVGGHIQMTLTDTEVNALSLGTYYWDLFITSGGQSEAILSGQFLVKGYGATDRTSVGSVQSVSNPSLIVALSGARGPLGPDGTDDQLASEVPTDTTNFNGNLSSADDTVQKALDTIDEISSGAGTDDQLASEVPTDTTNFDNNLSSADDTVQKALETLDELAGGGVSDHGGLTGLGDDDHTQYHNDARAGTWFTTTYPNTDTDSTDDLVQPGGAIDNSIPRFHTDGQLQTSNVVIDDNDEVSGVESIQLNTNPSAVQATGKMWWSPDDHTMNVGTSVAGVVLQVGQEMMVWARNNSGGTINNGVPVSVDGVQGNRPSVTPSDADLDAHAHKFIGLATHNISNNGNGFITTMGYVRDVDTSAWAAGTILYLSSTPGVLTSTPPTTPSHEVRVGMVIIQNATTGVICVRPDAGHDFNDLHDVYINGLADEDISIWDNANGYWKNTPGAAFIYEKLGDLTKEPTGHKDRTESTMSFTDLTRTFSISPVAASWDMYSDGVLIRKTGTENVVIGDTQGVWFIYYDSAGTLTASQTPWTFTSGQVFTAVIYWDATNNKGIMLEERHGIVMDNATHYYLHHTVGARYDSGCTGTFNPNNTLSITTCGTHDEDLEHEVTGPVTSVPVAYRHSGASTFQWDDTSTTYFKETAGILQYDSGTGPADVTNGSHVAYWIVKTNSETAGYEIWSIMGQREDTTLANARDNNTWDSLVLGDLPVNEVVILYRVIIKRTGTTESVEDVSDYRSVSTLPTGNFIASDHGTLSGLPDDDHLQYHNDARAATWLAALYPNLDTDNTDDVETGDIVVTVGTPGTDSNVPSEQAVREAFDTHESTYSHTLYVVDPIPDVDDTWTGQVSTVTAGETVAKNDVLYLKSDGKYWKADADNEADSESKLVMATAAINADANGVVLVNGYMRDDGSFNYAAGAKLYLSLTPGAPTGTIPPSSGDWIRVIGWAESADVVYFNPEHNAVQR